MMARALFADKENLVSIKTIDLGATLLQFRRFLQSFRMRALVQVVSDNGYNYYDQDLNDNQTSCRHQKSWKY
jgi:hypothetical protein